MFNREGFSLVISEPKISDTSIPVSEVEAWLDRFPEKRVENKPNHGIIINAPIVTTTGTKVLSTLSAKERRDKLAKAKREHKEAMRNLAERESKTAKEIAEQRKIWIAEAAKNNEQAAIDDAAKKAAAKERYKQTALKKREAKRALKPAPEVNKPPPRHAAQTQRKKERKDALRSELLAGKRVVQVDSSVSAGNKIQAAYKLQRLDIKELTVEFAALDKTIVKIKPPSESAYYIIDNLERYAPADKLIASTALNSDSRLVLKAVCSGKVLLVSDITSSSSSTNYKSQMMRNISKTYSIGISAIYKESKLIGWVAIDADAVMPDAPVTEPVAVEPVAPMSRVKEHERQMISEFAQRISKNYMSVGDAMLELQKIKERGIEFAYLEFERVAGECDSTVDAIISANCK